MRVGGNEEHCQLFVSRFADICTKHAGRQLGDGFFIGPASEQTASRFARDLMVQEVGHAKLRDRGIDLIAADNPSSFIDDTPILDDFLAASAQHKAAAYTI